MASNGATENQKNWLQGTQGLLSTNCSNEMKRVTWPNRKQVQGTTAVVIVSVFAVRGLFCGGGWGSRAYGHAGVSRPLRSRRWHDGCRRQDRSGGTGRLLSRTRSRKPCPRKKPAQTAPEEPCSGRTGRGSRRSCAATGRGQPQALVSSSTPIRDSSRRWRNRCSARAGFRVCRQDRAGSDSHRRSGGTAERQEGHQQAPGVSGLRAGGDGNERRAVARGEELRRA